MLRTAIVQTERGEPVAWDEGPAFETPGEVYELCRCGRSSTKPFCDSTHERIPFDGTETADRGPIAQRREAWEGEANHVLYDDLSLCTHAGFCRNVRTGVWEMVEEADDPERVLVSEELVKVKNAGAEGKLTNAQVLAELAEDRLVGKQLRRLIVHQKDVYFLLVHHLPINGVATFGWRGATARY